MLDLPESLYSMVASKFEIAKRSSNLVFTDTKLAEIRTSRGVPFQLRCAPGLAKKLGVITKDNADKPKPDPFDNPSTDLLVAEVPTASPSHVIVLNKYPVIKNHFILATKESKPQTAMLEPDDLSMAYACVQAWERDASKHRSRRLFAFFNSGEHSGASQAHRHLQFLPIEDMAGDQPKEWKPLLERMTTEVPSPFPNWRDPDLPFIHYATQLFPGISTQNLHSKYIHLLQAAIFGTKTDSETAPLDGPTEYNGEALISYNLAMTSEMMAICPRRSESAKVPAAGGVSSVVSINGTILGGTLMVKDEREWRSLKENPSLLDKVLTTIGYSTLEDGAQETIKL